jgi:hypothetical protein
VGAKKKFLEFCGNVCVVAQRSALEVARRWTPSPPGPSGLNDASRASGGPVCRQTTHTVVCRRISAALGRLSNQKRQWSNPPALQIVPGAAANDIPLIVNRTAVVLPAVVPERLPYLINLPPSKGQSGHGLSDE